MTNQTLKDINRAFKALEAIDEIKAEIGELYSNNFDDTVAWSYRAGLLDCMRIIDKHTKGEQE